MKHLVRVAVLAMVIPCAACQTQQQKEAYPSQQIKSSKSSYSWGAVAPQVEFRTDPAYLAEAEENLAKGTKFLAENGKKDGIITTVSGLQYRVIKEGSGKAPDYTSTIVTHYTCKLLDGTEIGNSKKQGKPLSCTIQQVIKAWTEAVLLMKEGGIIEIWAPANLGYGAHTNPASEIPPNSVLYFEIELIKVTKGDGP